MSCGIVHGNAVRRMHCVCKCAVFGNGELYSASGKYSCMFKICGGICGSFILYLNNEKSFQIIF